MQTACKTAGWLEHISGYRCGISGGKGLCSAGSGYFWKGFSVSDDLRCTYTVGQTAAGGGTETGRTGLAMLKRTSGGGTGAAAEPGADGKV